MELWQSEEALFLLAWVPTCQTRRHRDLSGSLTQHAPIRNHQWHEGGGDGQNGDDRDNGNDGSDNADG